MFELFIKRPILSTVISLVIFLLGVLALLSLPVTLFPDIVPPSVTVTARYTGANAEVMAKAVATPIERAINGVPGMTYMTTVCTNDGISVITVFFQVGIDPEIAAVSVQNRVTSILDELPEEVIKAGVITEKEVNSMLIYLNLVSTDSIQDEKFVYNFADINILTELKRIDGVGFAEIMGSREYSMRVWLKPDRMTAYQLSPQDITKALQEQNLEAAPGKTGISSDKNVQAIQYVLKYTGKFNTPEQYNNIIIKALPDGSYLRLSDIADVEFGSQDYNMVSVTDGKPSASIMIKQRPGSNAREVISNIKAKMAELEKTSFPPGLSYNFSYDVSRFLDASIYEVIKTLIEAFILVFLVVFIFLQDFRSTLIPAIAVPVSLVGTLFFMQTFGFSINLLTLFALVLAIGIVVDNAIVVVEAVHVKMEEGLAPYEATVAAMREIGGAIVAITLVMSAVFIPVSFMSGPVGIFYRQFSLTLAIAIVISGVNALTLSPALCALFLKKHHHGESEINKKGLALFFHKFNNVYNKLSFRYSNVLKKIAGKRAITYGTLIGFFLLTWGSASILPTGFIPTEDQGIIYINVNTPPGATLERTEKVMNDIQAVVNNIEEKESISTLAGYSLVTETAGASYGMGMLNLKKWNERKRSVNEIIRELETRTAHIRDAEIQFFSPPTVPGFGNSSGFELRVQDRTGSSLEQTAEITNKLVNKLNEQPEITNVFTNFNPEFPQYILHFDHQKAAKLGVNAQDALDGLQAYIGSFYSTNFIRFGQMYKVMIQAAPEYRAKPEDIFELYVKNKNGDMVPYSNFIHLEKVLGVEQLTRFNMFTSSLISGEPAPGYTSGEVIKITEKIANETLPKGYRFEWSGMTKEQIESGGQTFGIFFVCLIFVYLLLAAQYESFFLPLPVILSLPAGIFGAFAFLKFTGLENNIYAQVALVMLVGLLGKNAILIIEIAIQNRQKGLGILQSAINGGVERLRPILMTSFAFISGLIPLAVASGAGALGNRSIGTAAAGGMLVGTLVGIFLIPGLYVVFESIETKLKERKQKRLEL